MSLEDLSAMRARARVAIGEACSRAAHGVIQASNSTSRAIFRLTPTDPLEMAMHVYAGVAEGSKFPSIQTAALMMVGNAGLAKPHLAAAFYETVEGFKASPHPKLSRAAAEVIAAWEKIVPLEARRAARNQTPDRDGVREFEGRPGFKFKHRPGRRPGPGRRP